ncbi:MAG: autotransporter outer membrane beta-barrel domain-containing protein [Acidaminococcaceae bacterium]|nr:autotransporter outer membrane beta-barrel domain-containing protein [Acidaminococcaceae bacterium]
MKKNNRKSLLAGAVLASVLAGGMVPVQAANVNALVGPKDFGTLIGQNITFGQQRGYVENQTVTYPAGTPTWQIVAGDNGSITLLANQPWGYNRFSDTAGWMVKYVAIQQYFYQEALKYLNEDVSNFFSAEELRFLQNQTSVEGSHEYSGYAYPYDIDYGEAKYFGIFALPTTGQVNALGAEKRKREFPYWLIDGYNIKPDGEDLRRYVYYNRPFYYDVNTVQTDGSIAQQPGQDAEHIYPTINITPLFAYCEDKVQSDTFSSQEVWEPSAVSFTFKDTDREKNVNITKLSVAQEGITFDANGLATGEGQGIGGLLEDANGNYLAYARLADSINADGAVKDVKIKFDDTTITGNNTIHLFNEWIGDRYDLAGNFIDVGVEMNSNKISELTYLPNVQELILGDGVKLPLSGDCNFKKLTIGNGEFTYTAVNIQGARSGSFCYTECQAVKVTEALDWANVLQAEGEIILKGSFSVEDGTLTLVRPTNTDYYWRGITGWNDITYNGQVGQSATLKANGKMHGLVVNGGTFTSEKDLTLEDYLRVNNGAVVKLVGDVTAKNVNLNGTLNIATANKTIMVSNALNATGDVQIIGVNSSDKVAVGGNLMADGGLTLENVTLEAPNVQVADGIRGGNNVSIKVKDLQVKNMISADNVLVDNLQFVCAPSNAGALGIGNLTVKKFWDVADKNSQTGTIRNLNFGENGKAACYRFDLTVDYFTVSGKATGKVKPITQCFSGLENKTSYDVFTGSGDFSGLIMQDNWVTDMANQKTYILTQDVSNKGTLNVTASKHKNVIMGFAGDVRGRKIVLGNYWQEDNNGDGRVDTADDKEPVVWKIGKLANNEAVFYSDKILVETGGGVDMGEMWKITNFLKRDGSFAKDLFTASEIAVLSCAGEDALGLPSFDDVKDGGNYGWNVNDRKAQTTSYAGDNARYYAIGSTHIDEVTGRSGNVNDWVDSWNGDINIKYNLWYKFDDGGHYGIRPTITFDTFSVLFATNAEGGKGSCDVGNMIKLKDVVNASTLELTIDDAYLAAQNGTARKTGDVRVGVNKLEIGKDGIKTDYFTTYKDNNSYLSLFIGDAALPQDMFGYGKLAQVTKTGNGDLTLNLSDFTTRFADESVSGLALRFVNEYGNGTSLVGEFYDYGKMYLKDGKVILDLPVLNLPKDSISVEKGNKLIIRGTGNEYIVSRNNSYLQIKGEGTVAFDNVVFSNKNLSEGMDVEVNDATLRVEVNDRYENGAIVLKTANIVSKLNSVKGMEGTDGKLFLDITVMPLGFNETEWALGTSKTLRCLDAKSNNVAFNFDERYVIVGSRDMYEFAAGAKNGEVKITRKKVGNGAGNSGEAAFSLGWFQELKTNNINTVHFGGDFVIVDENHTLIDDQFTVNGNEHKLVGEEDAKGIIIGEGKTFTLKNISEINGFKDFAFRNGGILNIEGETLLRSNILNDQKLLLQKTLALKSAPVLNAAPTQQVIGTTNIDGTLIVDTPITIENKLNFQDNSSLKIIGSALNEGPAISGVNSLTLGDNVALQFDPSGIRSLNSEYPVIDGKVEPNELNKLQFDKWNIENIGTVFDANFANGKIAVSWNPDMANLGENLGVSRGAYTVAGLMGTAVQRHLKGKNTANLSSPCEGRGTACGGGVWATYIHNKDKIDGLKLGLGQEAKYDDQYNGTIVGYDFNQNSGVALAYVDGNTTNGYGGHNDGKHYGVSVYSKKKLGKAILSGDISYIHGKNELRQDINWENVKADAKTNTYSAGLHIANPVKLGQGTVTPFAGLRYMHINGKEYRNNLGVTYEGDKMNIFTAPFGLNYQVTVEDEKSGWQITPSIEVGYAFNFGDRNNDITVGYKTAKDSFGYDVTDKGYVFLQGGLNFTKKNLTLGVGYDFTKGSNSHNNRWNVNMNFRF